MKTQILLSLIYLLSISSFAQSTYYPLIDTGKTWHVMESYFPSPTLTYTYKCEGDTAISNNEYKILYSTDEEYPTEWTKIGYIREDTNKIVYYSPIFEGDSVFIDPAIIYNFNAELNDTLLITFFTHYYAQEVEVTVTEIDSVYIYDAYRKRIRFSCDTYDDNFWIEGIGGKNGLLENGYNCFDICSGMLLLCVKQEDTVIYHDPYFDECYIVAIEENIANQRKFEIYPNPADDFISIVPKAIDNSEYNFTIYNSLGQVIITTELNNLGVMKISTVGYEAGIYFYTVVTNNPPTIKIWLNIFANGSTFVASSLQRPVF